MPIPLTEQEGNPAYALRQEYTRLMAIQNPNELHDEAVKVVWPHRDRSMKRAKYQEFAATCWGLKDKLVQLQSYLTNFMLKADGMGVIGAYNDKR